MSLDSLSYLLEFYWPYLAAAAAIGIVAGWFSYAAAKSPANPSGDAGAPGPATPPAQK